MVMKNDTFICLGDVGNHEHSPNVNVTMKMYYSISMLTFTADEVCVSDTKCK